MLSKTSPWLAHMAVLLVLIALGSAWHFVFPALERWPRVQLLAAPFTPVNESVWEHFKMGFWPVILLGVLQAQRYLVSSQKAFWCALCSGLLINL